MTDEPVQKDRRKAAIAALETRIGHTFRDRELLERALTHASVAGASTKVTHNQRLEFLGDRVLGLLAAERLFAMDPEVREGEMTQRLHRLVNGHTCAAVARRLGLGEALRLSPGEAKSGGRDRDVILGDAAEALLAALYIDGGLELARRVFEAFWSDEAVAQSGERTKDPKTELQEWAQGRGAGIPVYDMISRTGPDHAPRFTIRVSVEGAPPETGEGGSRLAAEKAAAAKMLDSRLND